MTDRERVIEMLKDFDIQFEELSYHKGETIIHIEAKSCSKVIGYKNFCGEFAFDDDGKFLNIGFWE